MSTASLWRKCCPFHTGRIWHSSARAILGERLTISLRYAQVSLRKTRKEKLKYLHARWNFRESVKMTFQHIYTCAQTMCVTDNRSPKLKILSHYSHLAQPFIAMLSTFGSFDHGRTKEEFHIWACRSSLPFTDCAANQIWEHNAMVTTGYYLVLYYLVALWKMKSFLPLTDAYPLVLRVCLIFAFCFCLEWLSVTAPHVTPDFDICISIIDVENKQIQAKGCAFIRIVVSKKETWKNSIWFLSWP